MKNLIYVNGSSNANGFFFDNEFQICRMNKAKLIWAMPRQKRNHRINFMNLKSTRLIYRINQCFGFNNKECQAVEVWHSFVLS